MGLRCGPRRFVVSGGTAAACQPTRLHKASYCAGATRWIWRCRTHVALRIEAANSPACEDLCWQDRPMPRAGRDMKSQSVHRNHLGPPSQQALRTLHVQSSSRVSWPGQAIAPLAYGRLTPAGSVVELWDLFVRFRGWVWTGETGRWQVAVNSFGCKIGHCEQVSRQSCTFDGSVTGVTAPVTSGPGQITSAPRRALASGTFTAALGTVPE